ELARVGVQAALVAIAGHVTEPTRPRSRTQCARALNELRAEAERGHRGRFYGLATIPWQDTEAAVAGAPLDSEHLHPVYARLPKLDVPLCLHPARTIMEDRLRDY